MGKTEIILISGGARSGKSRMGLGLVKSSMQKAFLATASPSDDEMRARIEKHRRERNDTWITIEEPVNIAEILDEIPETAVVIDCLTLWLSNLLLLGMTDDEILKRFQRLSEVLRNRTQITLLITNEVGLGIVPENELARRFRDLAGIMNQNFADCASTVIFMVSGLPLYLKRKGLNYENR